MYKKWMSQMYLTKLRLRMIISFDYVGNEKCAQSLNQVNIIFIC